MSHHPVFLEYLILFHKATHFAVTVIVCVATKLRSTIQTGTVYLSADYIQPHAKHTGH